MTATCDGKTGSERYGGFGNDPGLRRGVDAPGQGRGWSELRRAAGKASHASGSLPVSDGAELRGGRGVGAGSFSAGVPVEGKLRSEREVYYVVVRSEERRVGKECRSR